MPRPATAFELLMKELFAKHGLAFNKVGAHLKIQDARKNYMPLCIERIALDKVGVMHFYIQEGDVMRDPDIVFWTPKAGGWYPLEFQLDRAALYVEIGTVENNILRYKPRPYNETVSFANFWASNLRDQGFLRFDAVEANEGE